MKGKKILSMLLALCILSAFLPMAAVPAAAELGGGDGSDTDPYRISTAAQLGEFRTLVNSGQIELCAVLTADIDLGGAEWTPIENYTGVFDGQGHSITGLNMNSNATYNGLFGKIDTNSSKVQNLNVSGTITVAKEGGDAFAGGIVSYLNKGTVTNCRSCVTITVTMSGSKSCYVGGVVGYNFYGTVSDCCATGTLTGSGELSNYVGGITGLCYKGTVADCYSTGAVMTDGSGSGFVGGIAGSNQEGTVQNCYYRTGTATKGVGMEIEATTVISALSAAQLKDSANFTGWDFTDTWYMGANGPMQKCFMPATLNSGAGVLRTGVNTAGAFSVRFSNLEWYVIAYDGKDENGQTISYEQESTSQTVDLYQTGTATLLATETAKSGPFISNWSGTADYSLSDLKKMLDGETGILGGFSAEEQAAMISRTLEGSGGTCGGDNYDSNKIQGDSVENALLWPLSVAEALKVDADLRYSVAHAPYHDSWWLRTPGVNPENAAYVAGDSGKVNTIGEKVWNGSWNEAHPAFYLDLSSVLLSSPAANGKTGDVGTLSAVGGYTGTDWKLTLLDGSRSDFTASFDSRDGDVWTVKYGGAKSGTDEYISALIVDGNGKTSYYGRLAAAESGENKTVTVDLSGKYNDGDVLYVFNEQYNGNNKTDYSSELKEIAMPVEYSVTATANIDGGGSVAADTLSGTEGTTVTVTATPELGYRFKEWKVVSGGVTLTNPGNAVTTFDIGTENVSVQAVFGEIEANFVSCTISAPDALTEGNSGTVIYAFTFDDDVSEAKFKQNANCKYDAATSGSSWNYSYDGGTHTWTVTYTFNQSSASGYARAEYPKETERSVKLIGLSNCSIQFAAGGGKVNPTSAQTNTSGKLSSLPTPVWESHAFDGWYTAENGGDPVTASTVFTNETTVYAHWSVLYPVTVNDGTGGGEYVEGASVKITANEPETGMKFKTWTGTDNLTFTSGNAATATATFTMPANSVSVGAIFQPKSYTVSCTAYPEAGGSLVAGGTDTLFNPGTQVSVLFKDTVTLMPSANEGYKLSSLSYTPENGTEKTIGIHDMPYTFGMPASNVTVKASFTLIECTVTFETNGGSDVTDVKVNYGNPVTEPDAPEKKSYAFAGWFADEGLETPFDFAANITSDTKIYAKWTPVSYSVSGGEDAEWTKGGDNGVVITVNRSEEEDTCFDHFTGVDIDGKPLEKDVDYTAIKGSVVITLKSTALEKLSVGKHTVTVNLDDGKAETNLTVKAAPAADSAVSPKTGDNSRIGLWITLMIISFCCLVTTLVVHKK